MISGEVVLVKCGLYNYMSGCGVSICHSRGLEISNNILEILKSNQELVVFAGVWCIYQ